VIPATGDLVRVRSRQYLVEGVNLPPNPGDATLVSLSCLEDDAQGERIDVLWEREVDAAVVRQTDWDRIASRGFDRPRLFSAFLHTLRWSCVTATDPKLFQAPYRAGIEVKAYQLQPLRMALGMPRVNLFIADDVGLGKTIEAGLVVRELTLRQRLRRVVICVPPSVVRQWRDEMEERFGLTFVVYDREFVANVRQERGFGVNPWTTHSRFILSHALVRDEAYAGPLRDWLGAFSSGSMLILDEAHNAAPSSGGRYAIDSKLTRSVRDLAPRFEHKLFLSATPHNGHSNSFSALLELLDPQRFVRGVPVDAKQRDAVMVRRLKADLRAIGEAFPKRTVRRVVIDNLPESAPELVLSGLLQRYRRAREARLAAASRAEQSAAMLVVLSLQKRLLSSIEAFAWTLEVHRKSVMKAAAAAPAAHDLLESAPGPDDERGELSEDEVRGEEQGQIEAATAATTAPPDALAAELALLDEMEAVARASRYAADPRVTHLLDWIRANQCPDLGAAGAAWLPRRVIIFTEYTDTKRYLEQLLGDRVATSDRGHQRIATFHGGIGEERREAIKAAFNSSPDAHPLRILIATDAAREGVNLQNHCADLFHFDVPWNPGRIEQRNGRIDRKLQRADEVTCSYFVLPQRAEDRVLDVLVQKTKQILEQLGSLTPVVARTIDLAFARGIEHDQVASIAATIEGAEAAPGVRVRTVDVEMGHEQAAVRRRRLDGQLGELRALLDQSRVWIGLDDRHFRDALSAALETVGAAGLTPASSAEAVADPERARWLLPHLHENKGADPTWAATLDSLRSPRKRGQSPAEWRREAPIRPVVFKDPGNLDGAVVHLHLEHRVVQRLLGRFLSQGFRDDDLSRACVLRTDEAQPRAVLLGRVSLFGAGGARLHDEVIAAAAAWVPVEQRRGRLAALGEGAKADVLRLVEEALSQKRLQDVPPGLADRLRANAGRDVAELTPHLMARADVLVDRATKLLSKRGDDEAREMGSILDAQRARIEAQEQKVAAEEAQVDLGFSAEEARQLAADRRHWRSRLEAIAHELAAEPARIRESYGVKARRVEPVGLVYLWPLSS
jgi:ERCC4-related helicase